MPKLIDLTGMIFGRLVVIGRAEENKNNKNVYWNCICDCGNKATPSGCSLKAGRSKSCGCYADEVRVSSNTTHGLSDTRIFHIFNGMKERCYNPNNKNYQHYGQRGIKICDGWLNDFVSFYNWSIKNGYRDNYSIDRINTNGNYEPGNCRWANFKTQQNNRTNNHPITLSGRTQTMTQWADETGIDARLIHARIVRLGWSEQKAITTPVRKTKLIGRNYL